MKKKFLYLGICLISILISACKQDVPAEDTTPPAVITEFKVVSEPGKILLSWTNPSDKDFYGAKIYTGIEENGTVNYDKGIILNRDDHNYTVTGLKDDGIYTFRVSAVDTSFNESSYVTSDKVVYKVKTVIKINNKFVCPECKKEYDTDEEAANCHGSQVFYTVKVPAGTYKVYHMLQNVNITNYHLETTEESKNLQENSTIDDVKKNYTGFTAKSITYNTSEVYVYYNRNVITYTFNTGSEGGFIDFSTSGTLFGKFGTIKTKTLTGAYGTKVPGIEKPKSEDYGFSKWNNTVPSTFGNENLTFNAEWTSITSCIGSDTVYGASDYVMLSKDSVTTSMGNAEINPFLMAKTEVTYAKWKNVIDWAKNHSYSCDVDFDKIGAAGSFITAVSKYKDLYTGTEYTGNPDEEKTYTDDKFYDKENNQIISKEIKLSLRTGKRYFVENNQNVYFERGDSLVIYTGNQVQPKESGAEKISVSDLVSVDVSDYVLFEGTSEETIYLSKEKYITPSPFTGDDYIKPEDPINGVSGYSSYFAEDENSNYITRLVKNNLENYYTGTDIVFVDANGKYVRIKKENGTIEKCYLDSTLPYIFGNSDKYVIKKANNKIVEIENKDFNYEESGIVPDIVYIEEDASEKKIYLLDTDNSKKYGQIKQNCYTFTMSYGSVYFTPWEGVKKISDGGILDRDSYSYSNDPVTRINWFIAAMWCNAASENDNLTPVYYKPGTTDFSSPSNVIRDATFTYTQNGELYYCTSDFANAVINPNANGYRLPTEAEWEYAARGGDQNSVAWNYTYSGSNNIDEVAWCYENSDLKSHPVGQKAPNTAGLYDMSGNVFEFCWSPILPDTSYHYIKVYVRGGSWSDPENFQHVNNRNAHIAAAMGNNKSDNDTTLDKKYYCWQYNVGFRVVRSVIQ